MALLVLAYLAVVLTALVVLSRCVFLLTFRKATSRSVSGLIISSVVFFGLTWDFFLGRLIYESQCMFLSGFEMEHPIDARESGYYVDDSNYVSGYGYQYKRFEKKAIEDLALGRIKFFEIKNRDSRYKVVRYFLSSKNDKRCFNPYAHRDEILSSSVSTQFIPTDKCLARESDNISKARYEVHGYDEDGQILNPYIIDKELANKKVAKFNYFTHSIPRIPNNKNLACPAKHRVPNDNLTSFVFLDKFGHVQSIAGDLEQRYRDKYFYLLAPGKKKSDYGLPSSETPCRDEIYNLQHEYKNIEHHRIYSSLGSENIQKSITLVAEKAPNPSIIDVFVNNTDSPIHLHLHGNRSTVWNIHQELGVNLVAISAFGEYPQAVVGPLRTTKIFNNFEYYNPELSCISKDFIYVPSVDGLGDFSSEQLNGRENKAEFIIGGHKKRNSEYFTYDDYKLSRYTDWLDYPAPAINQIINTHNDAMRISGSE